MTNAQNRKNISGFIWIVCFLAFATPFAFSEESLKPPTFSSPQELQIFLKENFKYKKDKKLFGVEDYWQTSEEFLKNRQGDCEDYAVFAEEELTKMGYSTFLLNIYGGERLAHTIAVFQDDKQFGVFDEEKLKFFKANTLEEVFSQYQPRAKWAAEVRPENHHAIITKRYKRVL